MQIPRTDGLWPRYTTILNSIWKVRNACVNSKPSHHLLGEVESPSQKSGAEEKRKQLYSHHCCTEHHEFREYCLRINENRIISVGKDLLWSSNKNAWPLRIIASLKLEKTPKILEPTINLSLLGPSLNHVPVLHLQFF